MARFKLYIEYDGTGYSGWQIQRDGTKTIQEELQRAAHTAFDTAHFELQGSGRTDAGVHALGQVAHLDFKTSLPPSAICYRLNDELPAAIHILKAELADSRFHARHDARSRSYLYQISRRRTAFGKRFVWWIKDLLDFEKMREAAALFTGMQDLRSFVEKTAREESTKVFIEDLELWQDGDLILLRVTGSHFIWRLVRRVVGVLAEVGRGQMPLSKVRHYLEHESDEPARLTAPASGLFLERVYYKGEERLGRPKPLVNIG